MLKEEIEIILDESYTKIRGIGNILFETMIPFISYSRIAYRNREFKITVNKRKDWFSDIKTMLTSLLNIIQTNKILEDKREVLS